MSTFTKMLKYVAGQVVATAAVTAARRVGAEAGNEIGKVAAQKSVEQLRKHVLKEDTAQQPTAPIQTGNTGLDALAGILLEQAKKNMSTKPEVKEKNSSVDITQTAEVVGAVVSDKTKQTVQVAKQISNGFKKGLKK